MNKKIGRREFALRGLGAVGAVSSFAAGIRSEPLRGAVLGREAITAPLKLRKLSAGFLKRLPQMMELAAVPGVAVAYVEDGRLSWSGEFGVKNANTREKVTADTVWQPASLSKPVFAFGVMKLVEAGRLDLDRPLIEYVPGELIKDEPRAKLITTRHALSHSTGLQNWRFQAGQNLQMSFTPGERWQYSGEGIYYVQRAVEQITGQGLDQFMRATVFGPLGMTSSSYFWMPDYEKRVVTEHNGQGTVAVDYLITNAPRIQKVADEWKKPVAEWHHEDQERAQAQVENRFPPLPTFFSMNAAGTLFAPIADYAKFVAAVIGNGLSDRSLAEVLKPQTRINSSISWGLGWGLQMDGGTTKFWHWGEGTNYRTFVIADRASRSAVIVFTNARNGRKIWERIVTEATGADQPLMVWLS
jgi:CubicO group peptidase (beta-lactamase class C family)